MRSVKHMPTGQFRFQGSYEDCVAFVMQHPDITVFQITGPVPHTIDAKYKALKPVGYWDHRNQSRH